MRLPPSNGSAAHEAGARAGNAFLRTLSRIRTGRVAGSMPIGLWQLAALQISVPVAEPRLVVVERLAHAVDIHLFCGARPFEGVAGPNDEVGAAAGRKAADLPAHADRFGGARGDHRQGFAPADSRRARDLLQADEVAGILSFHEQVAGI